MTINYSDSFTTALCQWRGSTYKAVLMDMIVWHVAYYALLLWQELGMDNEQRIYFAKVAVQFRRGLSYIPLTFLLGFFVAGVVSRWWSQFNWISWPDKLMMNVALAFPGEKNVGLRETIERWAVLQSAIAWRMLSARTKKRFPTEDHLVKSGLMTEQEKIMYDGFDGTYGKWFLPTLWTSNLLSNRRAAGEINSGMMKACFQALMGHRDGFAMLMVYDWIKVPLVYTQVVAIASYGYFIIAVIARQPALYDGSNDPMYSGYFPVFTTLQILFYMGWLKVGQYLMHPFGEDEDDFELNWILDRNRHVANLIGSQIVDQMPDRVVEQPIHLPHTMASIKIRDVAPVDPLRNVRIKANQQAYILQNDSETTRVSTPQLRNKNLHSTSRRHSTPGAKRLCVADSSYHDEMFQSSDDTDDDLQRMVQLVSPSATEMTTVHEEVLSSEKTE